MLQMYYLRTDVFSKKKEEFVETAMAFACDHEFRLTAPTTSPRAVLPIRSILSTSKRNKCRKLLLPAAARKTQLPSKLWSRKRRRRLAAVVDNGHSAELLCKLKFQQYNRSAGYASAVPHAHGSAEERQSIRDSVPGDRRPQITSSVPANGLCARSTSAHTRRRAPSHRLSPVAMERFVRSQRHQAHTEMPQRKRPHLRLLQSRSLESSLSIRYAPIESSAHWIHMTNSNSTFFSHKNYESDSIISFRRHLIREARKIFAAPS
jgi:hypothetical protein